VGTAVTPLYWATRQFLRRIYFSKLNIDVAGLENIPKKGAAIMVANHPSPFDGHLLCALSPRQFYSFARAELFDKRLARWHFWTVGSIPVTVGGDNQAATARAAKLLTDGKMFVMLPESDVYPGTTLHHFHGSFMKLSLLTGAPVLPVAIVGTEKAVETLRPQTLRDLRLRPCDVFVRFMRPLSFNNPTQDRLQFSQDVERVKQLVQLKVWEIVKNGPNQFQI
jgi:1-acyl-sn-glycerol-3-phosphate acyltransferase